MWPGRTARSYIIQVCTGTTVMTVMCKSFGSMVSSSRVPTGSTTRQVALHARPVVAGKVVAEDRQMLGGELTCNVQCSPWMPSYGGRSLG